MSAPSTHRIFIAGGGGIGRALGLLLRNEPTVDCEVVIGDLSSAVANEAAEFASAGGSSAAATGIEMPGEGSSAALDDVLAQSSAIIDCLPGSQAPRMARLALQHKCHYLNLTEYVAETNEVLALAKDADTCFALQCGLAPGYINVLAHDLFQKATRAWGVQGVDRIRMRVGALTRHATAPHYYGWTWSPVGVATEYVKDAIAVRGGETVTLPSLTERALLLVQGEPFEEALTSGGAADLPQALAGRVRDLDYKTLRYVGHYEWVAQTLASIPPGDDRPAKLQDAMEAVIPHCQDDLVVIYADVEGKDSAGNLRGLRQAIFAPSIEVAGRELRAIQSTTAAGVAEVLRLILEQDLKGPLLQSQVPTDAYLDGPFCGLAFASER